MRLLPGTDVIALADRFLIDHAGPSWPVNRWLSAMVALFHPEIVGLVQERDAAIAAHRDSHPDIDIFEDRDFEVTSILKIDVDAQIARVNQALESAGGGAAAGLPETVEYPIGNR